MAEDLDNPSGEDGLDDDLASEAGTPPPDGHIFDPQDYETEELALPRIDGQSVTKIAVVFSGTVWLDRGAAADVSLVRDVALGKPLNLVLEVVPAGVGFGYTTSQGGDLDTIAMRRGFKVRSVMRSAVPTPEETQEILGGDAMEDAA